MVSVISYPLAPSPATVYRGPWSNSANYVADDVVIRNGAYWIALRPNTNVDPRAGADWGPIPKATGEALADRMLEASATGDGVADDTTPLTAFLASGVSRIRLPATKTLKVTTVIPALATAGAAIDGQQAVILCDRNDATNNTTFTASRIRDLTIRVPDGKLIQRLCRDRDGDLPTVWSGVTIEQIVGVTPQQSNANDNNDAAVSIYNDGSRIDGLSIKNFDVALMIYGDYVTVNDFTADSYQKGIWLKTGVVGAHLKNCKFRSISPNATTESGQNAFTGNPEGDLVVQNCVIERSGEHGLYWSHGFNGPRGIGVVVADSQFRETGQCGIKLRHYEDVLISGVTFVDCSYGNASGSSVIAQDYADANENGFSIQRCKNVKIIGVSHHFVDETQTDSGWSGIFIGGSEDVEIDGYSVEGVRFSGIHIAGITDTVINPGTGTYYPDHTSARIKGAGIRMKNIGLASDASAGGGANFTAAAVLIDTRTHECGDVHLRIDVDGCTGPPVLILGTQIAAGAKIIVEGTYRNCGVALADYSALPQVDLSRLRCLDDTRGDPLSGVYAPAVIKWYRKHPTLPVAAQARYLSEAVDWAAIKAASIASLTVFGTVGAGRQGYDLLANASPWTLGTTTDHVGTVTALHTSQQSSLFSTSGGTIIAYTADDVQDDTYLFGNGSSSGANFLLYMRPRTVAGDLEVRVGNSTTRSVAAATAKGLYILTWDGSNYAVYRDGAPVLSGANTPTTIPAVAYAIGRQGSTIGTRRIGFAAHGPSVITGAQALGLYNKLRPVMDAVGAV